MKESIQSSYRCYCAGMCKVSVYVLVEVWFYSWGDGRWLQFNLTHVFMSNPILTYRGDIRGRRWEFCV